MVFGGRRRFLIGKKLADWGLGLLHRHPWLGRFAPPPLSEWLAVRDLPAPPEETFSDWWRGRAGRG